jgi:hypothetical protein
MASSVANNYEYPPDKRVHGGGTRQNGETTHQPHPTESRSHSMKTIRRASAMCAAAVAALVASTGTAQAIEPNYFYNSDNSMQVSYGEGGGAIFATVVDYRNPPGAPEVCQYHAVGVQGTPALPYVRQTTVVGPNASPPITIIFQQLGGHYAVDVSCQGTGNSAAFSPVIY